MKSITSKLSIIILSLMAMAFTFVLGSTSSKAVSDETGFAQCIANNNDFLSLPIYYPDDANTAAYTWQMGMNDRKALMAIKNCADANQ
ncbi:MAG: hypothetical protein HOE58_04330 [Porticoccaceae bacterium]|jgi:hypothetical protein|nr:hypothetical protein [Porticoccaceae bacterium]MBT4164027.1 hypothetical protein [Porticoccaceae bacterium]MBT4591908.1 hypothetical protein [Porticoccaceae bacterium]MBT7566337.1 hypothetical protein [Porticoccaceae bacterium]